MKRLAALALGLLPILALCCATPKTPRQLSNAVNFNVHYTETVRVTTEPSGAHVFLDDVFIGLTPVDAVLEVPNMRVKWPWKLGTGYYGPLLVEDDGKIRIIEALAVGYRSVRSDIDIEKSQALQKLLAQYQGDAELDSVEARKKVPAKMQTESKLHFDLGPARTAAGTAMRPRTGESSSDRGDRAHARKAHDSGDVGGPHSVRAGDPGKSRRGTHDQGDVQAIRRLLTSTGFEPVMRLNPVRS
ncbi:MAG: PEGA domain-containing protein [Planctomycetota bacterium]